MRNNDRLEYSPIKWFHSTFSQSSLEDFKNFLIPYKDKKVTEWLILTDYCLKDTKKFYDSITFTIVPNDFEYLKSFLGEIAPKDLKGTKEIDARFCEFIKSGECFNVTILLTKDDKKFLPISQENSLEQINMAIEQYQSWGIINPKNKEYYEKVIKKLNLLKQEAERKSFNVSLFRYIGFVQMIVAYLMTTITRECGYKIERIGWLSDRDKIVEWNERFIYDILQANYHAMCSDEGITEYEAQAITVADYEIGGKELWYEELNRIPDYITGALALQNHEGVIKEKYTTLFEKAFSNNPFLSVILYKEIDDSISPNRLTFTLRESK